MNAPWGRGVTHITSWQSLTLDYRDPEKPMRRGGGTPLTGLELNSTFEMVIWVSWLPKGKRYFENAFLTFAHAEVNLGNSIRIIDAPVREKRAARFEVKRPGIAADWRRAERGKMSLPTPARQARTAGTATVPSARRLRVGRKQPVIVFQIHEHGSESAIRSSRSPLRAIKWAT